MRLSRILQRMGALGAIAILALVSASPLSYYLREILQNPKTPISESAISTDIQAHEHEKKVCQHHPEGCPKECFCPKITVTETESEVASTQGWLGETAYTQCTEDPSRADGCAVLLLFPFSTWEYASYETISRLKPLPGISLVIRYSEPLPKIPIA